MLHLLLHKDDKVNIILYIVHNPYSYEQNSVGARLFAVKGNIMTDFYFENTTNVVLELKTH